MSKKYIFIIDTDRYAGNFERDMCAYVTGQIGDCGVGKEFVEIYHQEVKKGPDFGEFVELRPDEHGCYRPCKCWPTKGWLLVGDSVVREKDWNQAEADKAWQECQAEIYRGYLRQLDHVKIGKDGWTEENLAKEKKRCQTDIDKVLKEKSPKMMPNNSVAIFFCKKPTDEMVKLMKERAYKFAEAKRAYAGKKDISYEKNFELTILGFRLVEEKTSKRSKEV